MGVLTAFAYLGSLFTAAASVLHHSVLTAWSSFWSFSHPQCCTLPEDDAGFLGTGEEGQILVKHDWSAHPQHPSLERRSGRGLHLVRCAAGGRACLQLGDARNTWGRSPYLGGGPDEHAGGSRNT